MTPKDFARILNGREYRKEITSEESTIARENGIVVVFGGSDDLMEFSGAINDEVDVWDGDTIYINRNGVVVSECEFSGCPYFEKEKAGAATIEVVFGDSATWSYKTKIPHEEFNIMEDGYLYCCGIVFSVEDITN